MNAFNLITGLIGKTEREILQLEISPGCHLTKTGETVLDSAETCVTYCVDYNHGFTVIMDKDFGDCCVVQKTFWGDRTNQLFETLRRSAIPNKTFPDADGYFIEHPNLGFIFIEKTTAPPDGVLCVMASLETILYS